MEDLTKTQIVLLTLLVSFVTSIATGIITVSLLSQAPESVTQTINRVIEHTIEKVVPPDSDTANSNTTTVKEVTIVKEEDAILSSIDKVTQAVVRINSPTIIPGPGEFYAMGVIVTKDGYVLSDKRNLIQGGVYAVTLSDGTVLSANLIGADPDNHLAVFKIIPDAEHADKFHFVAPSKNELKLGQSVIAVQGKEKNSVSVGRVVSINSHTEKDESGADIKVQYSVMTDLSPSSETQGGPLLNLSGELVGLKTSNEDLTLPKSLYTTVVPILRIIEKSR